MATLYPEYVIEPFADFHVEFWAWVWAINDGQPSCPFCAIWPRGAAKSTSAELAVVALGAKKQRHYVLYVCETQDQADKHVANIAALLESPRIEAFYPELAQRAVTKYGNSKGWRRNRLWTASGLVVDALGLDSAARGAKVENQRPDLIVLDDIDDQNDSIDIVTRKIGDITRKVLPAGSTDMAVLAVQNLVHPDSVFSQLADGRAEFLSDRIVSGPFPAIYDLEYEPKPDGKGHRIVAGRAGWAGQDLITCQHFINTFGITAFLAEMQHNVEPPPGGMFDQVEFRRIKWDNVPELIRTVVWVDPAVTDTKQSDSMGIQLDGLGANGLVYRIRSWERRSSPREAVMKAIRWALEFGCEHVGIETDQGGDTWGDVYELACQQIRIEDGYRGNFPPMTWEKAGAGHGPKQHRASQMVPAYETGKFVHVEGTHAILERALRRFPKTKPLDLVDAAFWSFRDLTKAPVQTHDYTDGRLKGRR